MKTVRKHVSGEWIYFAFADGLNVWLLSIPSEANWNIGITIYLTQSNEILSESIIQRKPNAERYNLARYRKCRT